MRHVYLIGGFAAVALGAIGAVLPLLPTVDINWMNYLFIMLLPLPAVLMAVLVARLTRNLRPICSTIRNSVRRSGPGGRAARSAAGAKRRRPSPLPLAWDWHFS